MAGIMEKVKFTYDWPRNCGACGQLVQLSSERAWCGLCDEMVCLSCYRDEHSHEFGGE